MTSPRRACVLAVLLPVALAACGWANDDRGLIVNRSDDYLDARAAPPLVIPPDLDSGAVQDLLVVPEMGPSPRAQRYPDAAPRPEAIYARDEAQGVKIQKLGERRWLVVPQPPAVVWPKVKQFFADNGVAVVSEAPERGRLETEWMSLEGGNYQDVVRLTLRDAKHDANVSTGRDRLLVRVEEGVRERSAEVHIRFENDSLAMPEEAWPEASTIVQAEAEMLNELGAYIAADVAAEAVSFVARNIGAERKAELDWDRTGAPVLRLNLDFDRAWAVLGQALTNAEVEVTDLDRSHGVYYVKVTPATLNQEDGPGLFGRLFGGDEDARVLQLLMQQGEAGYQVSVLDEKQTPAPSELAQQLLLLIREYAT